MERELQLYPESKKELLISYLTLQLGSHQEQTNALLHAQIDLALKQGLNSKLDFANLVALYRLARQPEQSAKIKRLMKEKFPEVFDEDLYQEKLAAETDTVKMDRLIDTINQKSPLQQHWKFAYGYIAKKDWKGFENAMRKLQIEKSISVGVYNLATKAMLADSSNLDYCQEIGLRAYILIKENLLKPETDLPHYFSGRQWDKYKHELYAQSASLYASVLYQKKEYQKGMVYAQEAITLSKDAIAEQNQTYALLAAKLLPYIQYRDTLLAFIKAGKSTPVIRGILKAGYNQNNTTPVSFDAYIARADELSNELKTAGIHKMMLNQPAPLFMLKDLEGKSVSLESLKGKVIVLDFWATWCGPCKASFPGMQKALQKYKANPDVVFLFIDTWEKGDQKEKKARDFIRLNNYDFRVLMDNQNKVVDQFKISGIPSKFIIDANGHIRFRLTGFSGSVDEAVAEISTMIELASKG